MPATAANRPANYYAPEGIDPNTLQARYNPNAPTNLPPGGIFGSAAPPGMQSSTMPPPMPGMQPTGGIMSGQPGQPNYNWLARLLMGIQQRGY
jgi:hypothetical protein